MFRHLPMTGNALDLGQDHMPAMGEENVTGHLIHPLPGDHLLFCRKLSYLFLFWILRERCRMTAKTGLCLWQSGEGLTLYRLVAGSARKGKLTCMLLMVKGDGLSNIGAPY